MKLTYIYSLFSYLTKKTIPSSFYRHIVYNKLYKLDCILVKKTDNNYKNTLGNEYSIFYIPNYTYNHYVYVIYSIFMHS